MVFLCFVFEKMSSSLAMLLAMLLVHVGKRSNSRSQMFFETGVLKNFAIFTGKHLCRSLFKQSAGLTTCILIKEETLTQAFFCEYCEILKKNLFIEHLFIILFQKFM